MTLHSCRNRSAASSYPTLVSSEHMLLFGEAVLPALQLRYLDMVSRFGVNTINYLG